MTEPSNPPLGPEIRAQLEAAYRRFDLEEDTDGARRLRGAIVAGPALVGPPGRLHGGLHAVLRLVAPFERLTGTPQRPLSVSLDLLRAIPLGEEVPFEGSFSQEHGRARLWTRFRDTDRLLGEASDLAPDSARPDVAALRAAYLADREAPAVASILVRGSVDARIGQRFVAVTVDDRFDARPDHDLARYRAEGGTLDRVFTAVALDLVGATVGGFAWRNHLYTSRLTIDFFDTPSVARGCVILGDQGAMRERADSTLPGLEAGGVLRKETEIPVYLVDGALERVYARAIVTVYPSGVQVATEP